jgi:hypothetical protein
MSNDKVVEAAKKAEEQLRKTREAEDTLSAARSAAAVAMEEVIRVGREAEGLVTKVKEAQDILATIKLEAKVATEEAKMAGKREEKKEPLVTEVVEVSEIKPTGADKKLVLDFLQKNSWELRKNIKGVTDIRFEDDPPRVVFAVVSPEVKVPAPLEHNGVEIAVELEVRAAISTGTIPLGEDGSEGEIFHRSIAGEGAKALGIKDALGPHSATSESVKKREAYEAWIKRHPGVKRQ